jgi:hypothetical protein
MIRRLCKEILPAIASIVPGGLGALLGGGYDDNDQIDKKNK